jgi:xylobiose transport system permease protein
VSSTREAGPPGAIWAVPALLFFTLFAVVPMVLVVLLAFTSWSGLGSPHYAGMDNWRRLIHDHTFRESLRLSAILTGVSWAGQTVVALPIGVWAAGRGHIRAVLSAIFFVPLLMSSAAIALLWGTLLDPNFGLAHVVGPWLGVDDGNFIGRPSLVLYTLIVVISWQFVPFHVLLYQAATRQIPESLYEAARIDGAGRVREFFSITVPQLRNTIITSSVLMIVGSLTYFDVILILTNGGPGTSSRILPLHMYLEGFSSFNMGYASALAVVLLVIGTVVSLLITRVTGYSKMTSQREGL